jgi:hypothetical protein
MPCRKNGHAFRSCSRPSFAALFLPLILAAAVGAHAQSCQTADDMDAAARKGLEATAQRYFDLASRGDAEGLRQQAIPSVAVDFGGIETAIKNNQPNLVGAQSAVRAAFLLEAEGKEPLPRAEFLCGVFGKSGQTANSAVFLLTNLVPGMYAVVILDVQGKTPYTVSFVLQKAGADWKMGGLYAKPAQVAGHDAQWFLDHARELKAKGQTRSAWLYYLEARDLAAPVPFMSTMLTDKTYDESQGLQPSDLPSSDNAVDLVAAGKTYKLTAIYPVGFNTDLDLVVKYQAANVSDATQTYQNNVALIKGLVAKFPEFRESFAAIIARATEPSGKDYGTLLAVKDIP